MSKLVDSMLKVFKREKRPNNRQERRPRRGKSSVLDADSFVFMPGDSGEQYWGDILNDENFPISQFAGEDPGSRRKTHLGFVQSDDSTGLQEVNLIISHSAVEKEKEDLLLNGKVFNRRLSGTLVKASTATDEVEDGAVIRDYAFLLSTRDRLSQELSSCYVYDRLVRSPLHSVNTQSKELEGKMKASPLTERRRKISEKRDLLKSLPTSSISLQENLIRSNHGHLTCSVREERDRSVQIRPVHLSKQALDSQGYSNLDLLKSTTHSAAGSEYATPADAIKWEISVKGTTVLASK